MKSCYDDSGLYRYHEGKLSPKDEKEVRAHLDECSACRQRDDRLLSGQDRIVHMLRDLKLSQTVDSAGQSGEAVATITHDSTVVPSDAGEAIPLSIEGYRLIREIHRGGQGIVYEAYQHSMKRKVAVKVLLHGALSSASVRRRFEREIELVASLRHPNIISVHDSGKTDDGQLYYVMDYVSGRPLDKYIRGTHLSMEQTLELFTRVCDAVTFAHQRGVIHRDLKPSNILVDEQGVPRVLDFGLAKHLSGQIDRVASMTGEIVGTLPYMSPEQAQGTTSDIDTRTDVYALGVILFELLTGRYPYPVVGQMADVLNNIVKMPAATPSSQWTPESGVYRGRSRLLQSKRCPIDNEVQTIVLRCLAKERERRYESAGGLLRDVKRYLSGEPIEAKRDSVWYVLRKLAARHAIETTALAALLVIIISFGAISFGLYKKTKNALEAKNASDAAVLERSAELDAAVNSALQPAIRQMAFGWFLAAWRANDIEWARDILGQTPTTSPEHAGMMFLLDDEFTEERLLQTLPQELESFAYFLVGERARKAGRTAEAIIAFEECMARRGSDWWRSAARAALQQLRDRHADSQTSEVNP